MGAGLGAGVAAKLLNPDKPVVVVAGDGGFMMNVADLETAIRLKLDLVVVVVNDNGYGMIKWKQGSMGLADHGLNFGNPDFVKLAESFGAAGHRPDTAGDFRPTLEKALRAGGIHIIDLPIDYSENETLIGENLRQRTSQG
jgi:acetolactate synthase-1/2/3 large subunit